MKRAKKQASKLFKKAKRIIEAQDAVIEAAKNFARIHITSSVCKCVECRLGKAVAKLLRVENDECL